MKKIMFCALAALFALLATAEAGAQVAFFYNEIPEMALENESVEIKVFTEYNADDAKLQFPMNPMLCVRVRNKTDKMLYIDLGRSFLTVNDEPRCYYTPGSTSTTEGKSRGVSVNLGVVSGVLGGVNVGGGTSSSETTTTFAQRVVVVPPMSAKRLEPQQLLVVPVPEWGIYMYSGSSIGRNVENVPRCRLSGKTYEGVHKGQTKTYDPYESPVQFSVMVTCSFDEGCAETQLLRRGYAIDRLACYKLLDSQDVYEGRKSQEKLLKIFPEWHSWGNFFLIDGNY